MTTILNFISIHFLQKFNMTEQFYLVHLLSPLSWMTWPPLCKPFSLGLFTELDGRIHSAVAGWRGPNLTETPDLVPFYQPQQGVLLQRAEALGLSFGASVFQVLQEQWCLHLQGGGTSATGWIDTLSHTVKQEVNDKILLLLSISIPDAAKIAHFFVDGH